MKPTLDFRDDLIDKEVAEKLSKEVSSYIIEQVKHNMDKSIEERAKEYSKGQWDIPTAIKAYIAGATEQKAIDIEEVCEWLKARNVLTEASLEGFRKAMGKRLESEIDEYLKKM